MTRFVLELKSSADGPLAAPGIAQSKAIVGLESEIAALIEKAKTFGLVLTGEPRFVPEHKKPAPPANPAVPDPAMSDARPMDEAARELPAEHPRRRHAAE